jgi:hypothetical protein
MAMWRLPCHMAEICNEKKIIEKYSMEPDLEIELNSVKRALPHG